MGGISGLVSNALTGLEAAQQALQVTGNNIANVNTPGYNNESVLQVQQTSTLLGSYALGNGTQIQTVTRNYNAYLQGQVWSSTAMASGASTYNTQLQSVVNLIAGAGAGLSSTINGFFASGVAQVAANPSDSSSRQAMLNQAQGLANSFQNAASQLQQASTGVNQQIVQSVTTINSLTSQIAQLNVQIGSFSSAAATPNALLDTQNQLITQLSAQVGVTVMQQGNQVSVYAGSGQALVAGNQSFALAASGNAYDPTQSEVAYQSNGQVISQALQGGTLGGLLQFRSQVLQPAQDALGQIAAGIAQIMNDQQARGLNLSGNLGTAMFSTVAPQVLSDATNAGNVQLSASLVNASGLASQTNYMAKYDGSHWTVSNAGTGAFVASGSSLPLSFGGITLTSGSGTPSAGDSFEIDPTRYAALNLKSLLTSPSSIAAAAPYVSSAGSMASGSLVDNNLGNMVLSAGAYATSSGSAAVSGGALGSPPLPITITMTGSGSVSGSVGFTASQNGATIFSGTVSLGGSGTAVAIPYSSTPPGGYWTVNLSGSTAASGDSFTLSPGGPGNGNNAQSMAALQNTGVLNGGTTSVQAAYTQLASQVASQGNLGQSSLSAATAIAAQATSSQQSASGVNLDKQATLLMQYQQAYQAAATAIQIGNTLFTSLLQAV